MVEIPKPISKFPNNNDINYIFKLGEFFSLVKDKKGFKNKLNEIKKIKLKDELDSYMRDTLIDYFERHDKINFEYIDALIDKIKKNVIR